MDLIFTPSVMILHPTPADLSYHLLWIVWR